MQEQKTQSKKWLSEGRASQENGEVGTRNCHILIHTPFRFCLSAIIFHSITTCKYFFGITN